MSRHRNIRNMNYDDERDDEDDEEFHRYSISTDDETMSPGAEEYIYKRPNTNSFNNNRAGLCIADFIPEEGLPELVNDVVDDSGDFCIITDVRIPQRDGLAEKNMSRDHRSVRSRNEEIPLWEQVIKRKAEKASMNNNSEYSPEVSQMENLQVSEDMERNMGEKKSVNQSLKTSGGNRRLAALDIARNAIVQPPKSKPFQETKPVVNVVIVGHVDAGKSTLMGHLLYQVYF
ncbi:unnamed protein product [Onchocerca ochengi]|uniref:Tr-type G domain-containing protein n=1 Tax=Onchocerca ochengi TaxID=42157 RepID=A0A182EM74_ONCOC|nr:unnamed protein product [Onchocerca ochengi]